MPYPHVQGVTGIAGSTAAEAAAQRPEEKPRETAGRAGQRSSGICAVLGPSGAGKTTLIDILAGRKRDSGERHSHHSVLAGMCRPHGSCSSHKIPGRTWEACNCFCRMLHPHDEPGIIAGTRYATCGVCMLQE